MTPLAMELSPMFESKLTDVQGFKLEHKEFCSDEWDDSVDVQYTNIDEIFSLQCIFRGQKNKYREEN